MHNNKAVRCWSLVKFRCNVICNARFWVKTFTLAWRYMVLRNRRRLQVWIEPLTKKESLNLVCDLWRKNIISHCAECLCDRQCKILLYTLLPKMVCIRICRYCVQLLGVWFTHFRNIAWTSHRYLETMGREDILEDTETLQPTSFPEIYLSTLSNYHSYYTLLISYLYFQYSLV